MVAENNMSEIGTYYTVPPITQAPRIDLHKFEVHLSGQSKPDIIEANSVTIENRCIVFKRYAPNTCTMMPVMIYTDRIVDYISLIS